jgi:hypothetical protein
MRLNISQRSGNPKKIVKVVAGFVSSNPMHNKSFGLEGEEKFGFCKRKFDTMISSLENSHCLDKVKISLP